MSVDLVSQPRTTLLGNVFRGPAEKLFLVLRNDEELPTRLSGTDLDICVCPGRTLDEVLEYLIRVGAEVGWTAVAVSRRKHMIGFSLLRVDDPDTDAIHFDIFNGVSYLGLPLCDPDLLYDESSVRDGVRLLSARAKVLATVVHHLAWNGYLGKPKYRAEMAATLGGVGGDWLRAQLALVFGSEASTAITVAQLERASAWTRLTIASALLRRARVRLGVLGCVRRVFRYWFGQLASFRSPPGIVGSRGEWVRSSHRVVLSPELACRVSPHGCWAPSPRCRADAVKTLNGPRYQRTTSRAWRRWAVVRWTMPSVFLLYQAKRNRVVVLSGPLPIGLRLLRRLGNPAWLSMPVTARSADG